LSEAIEWYLDCVIRKTVDSLKKNGFEAEYVTDGNRAVEKILDLVPEDASVGLGGSVTLRELRLPEMLTDRGNKVADHWKARQRGDSPQAVMKIRREQINSDVFITSSNAITQTGELINIDGGGQRVAAMIFGPKMVIVVAGVNKISRTLEEGLWRVQNMASPMNAKRLNRKTPCVNTGLCNDCDSMDRICNVTTIINRRPSLTPVKVIIIGEDLGY
jgi:L-lactate utilization protein LutB